MANKYLLTYLLEKDPPHDDDLLSRGNVAPGQLHCPGASSSSSDHYEFIRIPLVFTQIVTENEF